MSLRKRTQVGARCSGERSVYGYKKAIEIFVIELFSILTMVTYRNLHVIKLYRTKYPHIQTSTSKIGTYEQDQWIV